MRLTRWGTACVAAFVALAALPDVVHACPVCFDRDDEARIAFLATTGLLTLLPLGMVAGVGTWLRKRAGRGEPGDSREPGGSRQQAGGRRSAGHAGDAGAYRAESASQRVL